MLRVRAFTARAFRARLFGKADAVASNVPPVAQFAYAPSGLTVAFQDQSTDSDGTIASWSWTFGDATSSTSQNPLKTYAAPGTYSVQLTVTDNGGATHNVTKSVTVSNPVVGSFWQRRRRGWRGIF